MALVILSSETASSPEILKALYDTFINVEEAPFPPTPDINPIGTADAYKRFRIKGQGVPDSDKYVRLTFGFAAKKQGESDVKIVNWDLADQTTGL
jgi:hypothetical protein